MALETIQVGQGDGPSLTFRFQERLPDGTLEPYDLVGATVAWLGKDKRADADGAAVFNYSGTITEDGATPGATYSEVTFNVNVAHTAAVRTYYSKIVATKGGAPDTIKQFWFEVVDT